MYQKDSIQFICNDIKDVKFEEFELPDLIIIDPPYYKIVKDSWDNQWKTMQEYIVWLESIISRVPYKNSTNIYIYGGIGEKSDSIIHIKLLMDRYFYFKDWITWKKSRGSGTRRGWVCTREELLWYVSNNKEFVWNITGQYSTERRVRDMGSNIIRESKAGYYAKSLYKRHTNVWTDISEQGYDVIRSNIHTTPKPKALTERLILAHTQPNDLILDIFMGTGNAAIVSKKLHRRYIGIDQSVEYIEEAIRRIEEG